MKRIIGVLFLLQLVIPGCMAQEKGDYFVRYIKEHLLYSQGDEVNVIDVDLEWPDAIDGADLRPLHTYLIKHLMGLQNDDFDICAVQGDVWSARDAAVCLHAR